jgi:PAS domain S-box-containing protein
VAKMSKRKSNLSEKKLSAEKKELQKHISEPESKPDKSENAFLQLINNIFSNAQFGCAYISDNKFLFINKKFTQITGYTKKDIPDVMAWLKLAYPNEETRNAIIKKLYTKAKHKRKTFTRTAKITSKKGTEKTIKFNDTILSENRILLFIEDLTEVQQASKALKENTQIFEEIFNSSNDAIYLWEVKGRSVNKLFMVNQAAEKMLGYSHEELLTKSPFEINPPENTIKVKKALSTIFRTGSARFLTQHQNKAGDIIDVEVNSRMINSGKNKYILSVARDFTDIINYQKSLKESEEKSRNIVDSMPIGIHFYELNKNNELVFTGYNKSANKILGFDNKNLLFKTIQEAFPNLAQTEIPEKYKDVAINGIPWQRYFYDYHDNELKNIFDINAFQLSAGKIAATFIDVTEQLMTEKALRNSEDSYKTFINQISEGIWRVDFENPIPIDIPIEEQIRLIMCDSKIGECNDVFVKMYGYNSIHDIIGKSLIDMYGGELNDTNNSANVQFVNSGYRLSNVLTIEKTKDGETKYFLNNAVGVIKDKFLVNIWGTQLDITHSKEVEKNNQILAGIIESTSDIVLTFMPNGKIVYVNESGLKILGYSNEQLNSVSISDIFPQQHLDKIQNEGITIANKYGLWQAELTILGTIKNEIPVSCVVIAHYSSANEVEYFSSIIRDVSEKMKFENALQESESKFKTIFESSPDGIILMKYDRIIDCNAASLNIFSCEKSELIGKTPFDFSPEFQPNGMKSKVYGKQLIDKTIETGSQFFEWQHINAKAEFIDAEVSLRKISITDEIYILAFIKDITVRKSAIDALKRSEELNRRLVESSPLGIIYVNRAGVINYENTASMIMMGLDPSKPSPVIGKNLLDLPGLKSLEAYEMMKKLMCGVTIQNEDLKFRSITGKELIIRVFAAPILNDENKYIGAIIMFQDITETVLMRDALSESQKKLQLVIENSPVFVYALDREGKFTFSEGKGLKILGLKSGQLTGHSVFDVYKDYHEIIEDHKKVLSGESVSNIYKVQNFDFDTHISPVFSIRNEIIGAIGIAFDITERKKKDDILQNLSVGISTRTGKDFFDSVVKYLSDIFKIDIMFIAEKFDSSSVRTISVFKDGIISENFTYNLEKTPCEDVISKTSVLFDGNFQDKYPMDEMLIYFGINSYLGLSLFDSHQEPIGVFVALNKGTFENPEFIESVMRIFAIRISAELERLKYESGMLKAIESAEKANRLKSEFLAQMSHEIRTPINTILSFASLLKEDLSDQINDELKPSFNAMDNAGRRIIRTIDLILNMSEIQTGSYEPYFTDFNLEDVIENIYLELLLIAKNKGIDLILNVQTNEMMIHADNYTVSQIINNLVDNAIKYTLKGQVEIIIRRNDTNELIVEIKDTGIGISKEYLPYLFTAFSQEESGYTRKFEGNGLGLALVKSYCEINNASIEVESEKNVGTTFRVIFH